MRYIPASPNKLKAIQELRAEAIARGIRSPYRISKHINYRLPSRYKRLNFIQATRFQSEQPSQDYKRLLTKDIPTHEDLD